MSKVIRSTRVGITLGIFKVWDHDDGTDVDAVEVHAVDAKSAVELWAELGLAEHEYRTEIEASVRDSQGRLWGCTVYARTEVTYHTDPLEELEEDGCTRKVRS